MAKQRIMGKKRFLVWLLAIFALFSVSASAAVIHGTLYDISLDKVTDAIVEINTEPKQQYVVKNTTYFFSAPAGDYQITAKKYSGTEVVESAEENITVKSEGDFILDLILFPSFEEEEEILAESDFDIETGLVAEETSYGWVAAVLIAVIAFFLILRMKGKEIIRSRERLEKEAREEAGDLKNVVAFIKKEGGRATQKDIRQQFPQSEAKISLVLTELEDKGLIKKIKKGRGNIIILKR
jgi:uncharacterized membrane protein